MNSIEIRAVSSLSLIMALRLIGLFMIMPIFSLYAQELKGATPFLIGLGIGIYGLSQGLLQLPFGMLSDQFGRRPIILMGLILFALGSLIAALSNSIYGVILGRILQGSGAVSSTIIALVSDLTREEHRTKAMGISGITIGISFFLSMIIGPLLAEWMKFQSMFLVAFSASLVAIFILFAWVPQPQQRIQISREKVLSRFKKVLINSDLRKLNIGIFFLHAILTACFVALPITLNKTLGYQQQDEWRIYVPTLLIAFAISFLGISFSEKNKQVKTYFLASILILFFSLAGFYLLPVTYSVTFLCIILFFTALSLLESFLPSFVSRFAPTQDRGTALGLYSCLQFLGIFFGGVLGGLIYQYLGFKYIYLFSFILSLIWFLITFKMHSPSEIISYTFEVSQPSRWVELFPQLQKLPGIVDILFFPENNNVCLKMDHKVTENPEFRRLEQFLTSQ